MKTGAYFKHLYNHFKFNTMEQQSTILLDYLALFIQQQLAHKQIVSMIKKDANLSASNRNTLMNFINSIKTK